MSSYPEDDHHYSGCFGRSRRTPSGANTHRGGLFSFGQGGRTVLPPLSSAFRPSRSTVPDHSSSHTHQDLTGEGRNEYNTPSNDPSTWSGYNTIGQQSSFAAYDNDPRQHQYSYPAPQQIPYSSYPSRDLASSYPINPAESRTLPPINVHNDRWQQAGYPSSVGRQTENIYSPVATYPPTSYPQFSSHQPQQSPHHAIQVTDPRNLPSAVPIAGSSTHQSASTHRRPSLSADRASTVRTSMHSSSPYARHPHQSDASADPPQVKKKRKRADAEQLKVLNEVYSRTAFPSTEERQDLANRLNMTPRSVQIWFQNKRQSMRNTHRQSGPVRGTGTEPSSATSSHPSTTSQLVSRSSHVTVAVPSLPAIPSRPSSIESPSHATYIPPSPTDPSMYPVGRPITMHQGHTPTSNHRPPSRSRESYSEYYDGSRRGRG